MMRRDNTSVKKKKYVEERVGGRGAGKVRSNLPRLLVWFGCDLSKRERSAGESWRAGMFGAFSPESAR